MLATKNSDGKITIYKDYATEKQLIDNSTRKIIEDYSEQLNMAFAEVFEYMLGNSSIWKGKDADSFSRIINALASSSVKAMHKSYDKINSSYQMIYDNLQPNLQEYETNINEYNTLIDEKKSIDANHQFYLGQLQKAKNEEGDTLV